MSKKRTHKEFIDSMAKINTNIKIVGEYVNNHTKIKCLCLIDNHLWEARPQHLLEGSGCPVCGRKKARKALLKTEKEFINEMKEINPNIKIIGTYKTSRIKIECQCQIDNYIWSATPCSLLNGKGCPKCGGHVPKTTDDFINELKIINPNINVIDEYINAKTKIKCRCLIDGNIWYANPTKLLRGTGCPICNVSKGEKKCADYFKAQNISYVSQFEYSDLLGIGGKNLKFDFAIINKNQEILGLVEYDGEFHYKKQYYDDSYEIGQIHDAKKNDYCFKHNIPLLRIPYWEYDNVDIILDKFIKNILPLDCEVKNISC